jgi:hypothetical protein
MNIPENRWLLTDEKVQQLSGPKARIRVLGKFYFVDPNQEDLMVGDMVLDRGDGCCHGVIDFIMPSNLNSKNIELQAAVGDGCAIECGVPLRRLIRLKPFPEVTAN